MSQSLTRTADSSVLPAATKQTPLKRTGATAGRAPTASAVGRSSVSPIENRPPLKRWNPRPPSDRDLQIYKMVKIQRAEHWAVAAKFNLHDSRVSQIIKKVNRWIAAGGSPTDPELRDHLARQRVSRAIQRLRLVRAIELATYAVESESSPLKKTRRRWVGGTEVWCEETSYPQPEVGPSAVRLLLKAN